MQDLAINTLDGAFGQALSAPIAEATGVVAAAGLSAALPVYTYDQIANVLINGLGSQAGSEVRFNVSSGATLTVNLTGITNSLAQNLARTALQLWSDASGLFFSEVASGGQIVFSDDQTGAFASQDKVGGFATTAYVNVGTGWVSTYGTSINSYTFQTYIHEIGHALGLNHGGDYNGNATYSIDAGYANDCWATTVMSYFDQQQNSYYASQGFSRYYVVTPMMADLLAIRALYGGSNTLRTGNTVYGYNSTAGGTMFNAATYVTVALTIEDDGGIDTLDYSGSFANQTINLNPETFSNVNGGTGNLAIARGTIIENAIGGSGFDTLIGNAFNNVLNGGGGSDTLIGGGGADTLIGGLGNDFASYLTSTVGLVVVMVASGNSTGDAAGDTLDGIEGLIGSLYADSLRGDANANQLYGRDGADWIYGRGGADQIYGEEGNDTLYGNDGNDYIDGGNGDDRLIGGAGSDNLQGGAGFDLASYEDSATGLTVDLASPFNNTGDAIGDSYFGIEAIGGSPFNDVLRGDFQANSLFGGLGNDTLVGRDGNDTLFGEAGDDVLNGGNGADALSGGDGMDLASYADATAAVTVDLAAPGSNTGEALGDVYYSIEGVIGTNYIDTLRGDAGANTFYGGGDSDTIYGMGGNDTLFGEAGQDRLNGGAGDDLLYGGDNEDRLVGGAGADLLNGQAGLDAASYEDATAGLIADLQFAANNTGDAAGDTYVSIEWLYGSNFNDSLRGDAGDNLIQGGAGIDWLYGRDGNDTLYGGTEDDTLFGDAGNDTLNGDDGNDRLFGGIGTDALYGGNGDDVLNGGANPDTLVGGAGFDIASYEDAAAGLTIDMANPLGGTGDANGDSFSQIEGVLGSAFNDIIRGDGLANTLMGGAGNDSLAGNAGDDILIGGLGGDAMDGGTGTDYASYAQSLGGVYVDMINLASQAGEAAGDTFVSIEGIIGSAFVDFLGGDNLGNNINGGDGNDTIEGRGGDDMLQGGAGGDLLNGGTGFDYATYAKSSQGLVVDLQFAASNSGEAAGDTFTAVEGLIGTAFDDSLRGDAGDNWIYGGAGIDYIYGRDGNDVLLGEDGNDTIQGNAGIDALYGGLGNDRLYGGAGADTLNGGDGLDFAMYGDATAGVTANLGAPGYNTGDAAGDVYVSIEGLSGSNFADRLTGDALANFIYGELGNDVLLGGDGGDTLLGGAGNDQLYGEGGDDILWGGDDADLLDGGAGFDYVNYSDAASGGVVDLVAWANNTGMAAGDNYYNIEGIVGSAFADSLRGNSAANTILAGNGDDWVYGREGNDVLYGEAGNDTLFGNEGDDTLIGGVGGDALDGGAGYDTVSYADSTAGLVIDLQLAGNNTGIAAGDSYAGIENVTGSAFADSIRGDAGGNLLSGGDGADYIYGRDGNDVLLGGNGDDTLLGNSGADVLYGGAGNDTFYFGVGDGKDIIGDFTAGAGTPDVIYISTALGVTSLSTLLARAADTSGGVVITFDANTSLTLTGVTMASLNAADFVFY